MDYGRELLLVVATTFVSGGVAKMAADDWLVGGGLLLVGALVFVGRGFYKKYFGDKK